MLYTWHNLFGGIKVSGGMRLKELEASGADSITAVESNIDRRDIPRAPFRRRGHMDIID
ncbi:hypothetical protein L1787_13365 [Acuticoccus sp. M5D2P5]|uniref:hypothetical protein n=1 Tax=Acuticoccus kalidii TaxID=2910977 RepID=UPI001F2B4606|nr:hypothetical protein [Acuticoccus kalidii]MCF3934394.1 hypothetical protein [Acuticoccus kalidii]